MKISDPELTSAEFRDTCHAAIANPYKLGIGMLMFMSERQRAIYHAIDKSFKGVDVRAMDRDRLQLELLGVW